MIYINNNFCIKTDYKIKEIMNDGINIDLIIMIEDRCLNINFDDFPKYFNSRLQFQKVRNILFRFCTSIDNNLCTVHMLSNSDIYSSMANFEIEYSKHIIEISDKEYYVKMGIIRK